MKEKQNGIRTLLFSVLDRVEFVYSGTEVGGITTEGDFERSQEFVHTGQEGLGSTKTLSLTIKDIPVDR